MQQSTQVMQLVLLLGRVLQVLRMYAGGWQDPLVAEEMLRESEQVIKQVFNSEYRD